MISSPLNTKVLHANMQGLFLFIMASNRMYVLSPWSMQVAVIRPMCHCPDTFAIVMRKVPPEAGVAPFRWGDRTKVEPVA